MCYVRFLPYILSLCVIVLYILIKISMFHPQVSLKEQLIHVCFFPCILNEIIFRYNFSPSPQVFCDVIGKLILRDYRLGKDSKGRKPCIPYFVHVGKV